MKVKGKAGHISISSFILATTKMVQRQRTHDKQPMKASLGTERVLSVACSPILRSIRVERVTAASCSGRSASTMPGVDHVDGGGFHPMSHLFASYIPLATRDASVTESEKVCAECRDAIEKIAYTNYNSRVNEVMAFAEARIIDSSQYWNQLESVENPADQDAACAALYKYLFANVCEADIAKEAFETTMARCYLKERLNVLELVVWKALCLVQIPSTVKDLHEWNAWCRGGWKNLKPDVRHASGLAVVMSGIFPFINQVDESIQRPATRYNVEFGNTWFRPGPQEKKSSFHPVDHLFLDFATMPTTTKRVACSACEPWSRYHILTTSERIDSLVLRNFHFL
jgi:hypothetical protein